MPKGIRPTQSKVRKAIFDILGDIKGLSFLELFSGSGAVGFEAASAGVAKLTLVEHDHGCWLTIKNNIESLKLKGCDLSREQAGPVIKRFHGEKRQFDIIFLDPPYYKSMSSRSRSGLKVSPDESLAKKTLQMLEAYDILAPNGFIIVQHFKKDDLPDKVGNLTCFKEASYADTVLSFYKRLLGEYVPDSYICGFL